MKSLTKKVTATLLKKVSKYMAIDATYIARGGFWLIVSQVITMVGSLLISVVFANKLNEIDYGTYKYILGIGILLSTFSLTGMGQAVLQASSKKYPGFFRYGVYVSFAYSLGIIIACIIGSIYYFYNDNNVLGIGCLLIGIFYPLSNTYQQIFFFLQGSKRLRESTMLQIGKTIFITFTSLCALYITHDILILIFVFLASNALANFCGYIVYKPDHETLDTDIKIKYLQYAKHTSVRNILAGFAFRLDTVLVFQQLGAVELAIYSLANIIPEQITGSLKNMNTLLVPRYAEHSNIDSIRKNILKKSIKLFYVISAIALIYILLAPLVYHLLFPKYEESIFLSQILALSLPAMIAIIPISALQSQHKEKELHYFNLQSSVLLILFTIIFIFMYGLMGAIIAKVLSRYANLFMAYYHLFKSK